MNRPVGLLAVGGAIMLAAAGAIVSTTTLTLGPSTISGVSTTVVVTKGLFAAAVVSGLWGLHLLVLGALLRTASKRRAHDIPIADFCERLAETPVELRLRYVVHPRRGTRVRNERADPGSVRREPDGDELPGQLEPLIGVDTTPSTGYRKGKITDRSGRW